MGKFLIFLIILLIPAIANAVCITPAESMEIRENALFCYGTYNIGNGVNIANDNVIVDCGNSVLIGNGIGYGILLKNKKNITIQNCNISNYEIGIYLDNANNSIIEHNYLAKNKFGIALFNSFDNDAGNNVLIDNIANNAINYFPDSLIEEKGIEAKEAEKPATPQNIIEEVIKVKKPLLRQDEVIGEVNLILNRYLNITQQNLEITRTILYDDTDKSTSIMLQLKPKKVLLNVSIYEKIPKCISAYASQILFETGGYEVIRNDPLILWTFSRLENEKEITYKVLKNIGEECKSLLFAFGIAAELEEFGKTEKKEEKKTNYFLIFAVVILLILIFYILKIAKK